MTLVKDMTADTSPDRAGIVYYVDDPTGTPLDRKVTLANLVKNGVTRYVTIPLYGIRESPAVAVTTAAMGWITIPPDVGGMNLTYVFASHCIVGSGQASAHTIDIHNVTDTTDMLSTNLTIDANELDSSTAATAAVIDTSYDDVATNDQLRIDVDAITTGGTAPKGLYVTLGFSWPT
jgi:hypothetical protein